MNSKTHLRLMVFAFCLAFAINASGGEWRAAAYCAFMAGIGALVLVFGFSKKAAEKQPD